MGVLIIISVLLAAGAFANFLGDPINWTEGIACAVLSVSGALMMGWLWISHRRAHKILLWLRDHKDELTDDPQFFRDSPVFDKTISNKTTLRSFKIATSFFFVTSVDELGMEIRHGIWAGFFATAWTLVFGWWGLPWGPIRTIQVLYHNLTGGDHITAKSAILKEEMDWDFESGERR